MDIGLKGNFENLKVGDKIKLDDFFMYTIVSIKEGGMAFVLIVERITDAPFFDQLHRKMLAIKIFKSPTMFRLKKIDPKLFEHELRIWIQIDTPNVVPLLKIVHLQDTISAIMPFYESDLRQIIKNTGKFNEHSSVLLLLNVIKGLFGPYEKLKIIHQDIKPENVLANSDKLLSDTSFYVSDWGISNVQNYFIPKEPGMCTKYEYAESLSSIGTLAYMSPERLMGGPARIESDIYSLGIMFFEMLFGLRPFDETEDLLSQIMTFKYYEKVGNYLKNMENSKIRNILLKCIHPNINLRYSNYDKMIHDLYKIIKPKRKWFS